MKSLFTILVIVLAFNSLGQIPEVKFREEILKNGLNYPQVVIPANKEHENLINTDLKKHITPLDSNDFCLGQYGYVQKGTHLQIHVFCNCIDFDESKNFYYLYNLENGLPVPYSSLIEPKKIVEAGQLLSDKAKAFASTHSLQYSEEFHTEIQESTFDAFQCEMKRDGIDFWPKDGTWESKRLFITWVDLKKILRFHFI